MSSSRGPAFSLASSKLEPNLTHNRDLSVHNGIGKPLAHQAGHFPENHHSEASTFRENTDTQFGKKPVVTSAHPPVLDIRSD